MSKTKVNITEGVHDLVLGHFKLKEGKAYFFFQSMHHDCKEVQRTFTQGSDSLKGFLKKLTNKEQGVAFESNCRPLVGKILRVEIVQSKKNPQFMDLNKVLSVVATPQEVCPCNNSVLSVNDRKITGGGHDA